MAKDRDADVIVLGAGVAGLAAAAEICKSKSVLVLEARGRIGGRILTHRSSDDPLPIDLGPEFVHGRPKETFDLLDDAKLLAYEVSFNQFEAGAGKPRRADGSWDQVDALLGKLREPKSDKLDRSFADFLKDHPDLPPKVRKRALSYIEGFNAARADRISIRSIVLSNEEEDATQGERQHRLIGGYDQLVDVLASRVAAPSRIEMNTIVRSVKWRRRSVQVMADTPGGSRTYAASQLVVALPLGVLQQSPDAPGGVRFDPPLPVETAIRDALVMGHVHKITLTCRTPFWETDGDLDIGFIHAPEQPIAVWWTSHPIRSRRLVGWVGGSKAEAMPGDKASLTKLAVQSLANIFHRRPSEIAKQITAVHVHDWMHDPFSRGSYSYVAVGGVDAADTLAKPIDGTIVFAGEHTHRGLIGTVAGAIQTGYRAARLVHAGP